MACLFSSIYISLHPYDDLLTLMNVFKAAYIINGNCKNIMNMSEADQLDLWQSVLKGTASIHFHGLLTGY